VKGWYTYSTDGVACSDEFVVMVVNQRLSFTIELPDFCREQDERDRDF